MEVGNNLKKKKSSSSSSDPLFTTSTRSTWRNNGPSDDIWEQKVEKPKQKSKKEEKLKSLNQKTSEKNAKINTNSNNLNTKTTPKTNSTVKASKSEVKESKSLQKVEISPEISQNSENTKKTRSRTNHNFTISNQTSVETKKPKRKVERKLEKEKKTEEKLGKLEKMEEELAHKEYLSIVNNNLKLKKSTPFDENNNNSLFSQNREEPFSFGRGLKNGLDPIKRLEEFKELLQSSRSIQPSSLPPRELILKSHRPHLAGGMLSLVGNHGADLNELLWDFVISIDCPETQNAKNQKLCSVCSARIDSTHSTAILNCSHLFHSTCLEPFESVDSDAPECPLCARELKLREEKKRIELQLEEEKKIEEENIREAMEKKEMEREVRAKKAKERKLEEERKRIEKLKNNLNNSNSNPKGNVRGRKREVTQPTVEESSLQKIEKSRRNPRKKQRN